MTEPSPDELRIRAEHKQELARIEAEHDLQLAQLDAQAFGRAPFSLRMLFDDRLAAKVEKVAERMAKAVGFTPSHLIGKTEACMVVVTRAVTWNLDPYQVAMTTYQTPDGKIGYEGALVRAILEASGELKGAIRQEWYGDWGRLPRPSFRMVEKRRHDGKTYKVPEPAWEYWGAIEHGLGVRVSAILASTGEEMSLEFDLVDAYPRNATTWPTRPKLQILNPAIRAFAKMVRPSLLMGVHFADDQTEEPNEPRDVTPSRASIAYDDPMDRVVAEARGNGGEPQAAASTTSPISELTKDWPSEKLAAVELRKAELREEMPKQTPSESAEPPKRRGRPTKAETVARQIISEIEATEPEYVDEYVVQRKAEIDALPDEHRAAIETARSHRLLDAIDEDGQYYDRQPEPVPHDPETGEIEPEPDPYHEWLTNMRSTVLGERPEFLAGVVKRYQGQAISDWGDHPSAIEEVGKAIAARQSS